MKKNEIFSFTAPNGAKVTAVVTAIISSTEHQTIALCYAQNKLFTFYVHYAIVDGEECSDYSCGETLVDYAVLPDYDAALEMAGFDEEEADILFERDSHTQAINTVKAMGYNEKEAINILEGKNADGSDFEKLPF